MSREKRKVPLYQQGKQQVAGATARLADGTAPDAQAATWNVTADSLGGIVPAVGDRCRDTAGRWWSVKTVGALTDGIYPLACEREGAK